MQIAPPHTDFDGFAMQLLDTFGTTSPAFVQQSLGRLGAVVRSRNEAMPTADELNAAIAAVDGPNPDDEVEAMLAVQMVSTHDVAMEMLTRAKRAETLSQAREQGALAAKLLRAYAAQVEALARLRRGGIQDVRVVHQHVNVGTGGQAAVVGTFGTGGRSVKN